MKEPDIFTHQYQVLTSVKETLNNPRSKDELLTQLSMLAREYETLLDKVSSSREMSNSQAFQPGEIREIKSRLLSHITHEFLTPLNLIITPLEQMLSQCRNPERKKMYSMMYRNGQRLLLIIGQILELLKLESGKLKLKASRQNLILFLKGIAANFELLSREKEVDLIVNAPAENLFLYFDQEKIAEVMCNLIMNSLKHTAPGGVVSLSVRDLPADSVEISVYNTGTEIPLDQTSRIFDRYYQLRERFEHYIKGLGTGLFLAREYIKLHHGTIRVNSSEEKGTEFIILLPKGKDHLQPGEILESPGVHGTGAAGDKISKHYAFMLELEGEEKDAGQNQADKIPGVETERADGDGDVVLVVEDSVDMRSYIKTFLAEAGFIVSEAPDGKQGLKMAGKLIPDIVISDVVMPEMSGYQLCRQLKKDIGTSHIPVILLSVNYEDDEIARGLEAGADDYVIKPFNPDILLKRVKNLINLRRRLQQKVQLETVVHSAELDLSDLDNQFIKRVSETIETNLSDPGFGLEQLADILYMSRTTLHRKLVSLTGHSPNKFIQSYRLKRSVELLKSNYGNVTEVAFRVGFSNSAYFTKCFKEKFNRLPSDFNVR